MTKFAPFVILLILAVFPGVVGAAGLVPCEGTECSACNLVEMGNTILQWLIGVLFVVFAVVAAMGGFALVTSGGNPEAKSNAKSKLVNALVGLIIVFGAWILVDTIMRGLLASGTDEISGYGPWSQVKCGTQTQSEDAPSPPVETPSDVTCTDTASLVTKYGGSPIGAVYEPLNDMISCYTSNPKLSGKIDMAQVYTKDLSYPICAATNGNPVCGACSHSVDSCHYGRGSGNGAMGVDFNANLSVISESELYKLIQDVQKSCGGKLKYESNHTHVSYDSSAVAKFGGVACQ
jgi:hypothetical protein